MFLGLSASAFFLHLITTTILSPHAAALALALRQMTQYHDCGGSFYCTRLDPSLAWKCCGAWRPGLSLDGEIVSGSPIDTNPVDFAKLVNEECRCVSSSNPLDYRNPAVAAQMDGVYKAAFGPITPDTDLSKEKR